jgi:hypothetical protein
MDDPIEAEEITLRNSEELREIALQMALNCRRTLDITSRNLDPAIYDQALFADAIKQIVLNNRLARIRFLITDPAPVVSRGHRLIDLSSRLSSFISIRKPGRDHRNFNEAMLLADNTAYIHRRFADRYEGIACHDDKRRASDLTGQFEEIWERAEIDPNFRRLHL